MAAMGGAPCVQQRLWHEIITASRWNFVIELPLVSHCSFASTQFFSLFVFTRKLIAERIAIGVYTSQTITTTSKLHTDRSIFAVVVIAA